MFSREADKRNERTIAKWCEGRFGITAHLYNDPTSSMDGWFEKDGECVAFFECRTRMNAMTAYNTLRVAERKITTMLNHALTHTKPCIFVAWWKPSNDFAWFDVRKLPFPMDINVMRRGVKRAKNDDEPVFEIPLTVMSR